jgi:hypothetical protein
MTQVRDGLIDGQPLFPLPLNELGGFDTQLNAYREYIGWHQEPRIAAPAIHTTKWRQTLILNDIHAPFQHEAAIAWAIRTFSGVDEAFVAGDLADMWSFSRHPKSFRETTPLIDYRSTQKVLNILAESFRKVTVMRGNHCTRQHKYFAELLPIEVLQYLETTAKGALHPLDKMADELPNVEMIEPKRSGYAQYGFLHEIGDAVISHAEIYSKIPNKAAGNLVQWLMSYAIPQGIINPDFKVAFQAHTHQAGKVYDNFGKVNFELGCLCHTQGYQGTPKLLGVRPPVRGVTLLVQDQNGKTELNETNFYQYPGDEEKEPVMPALVPAII